ncbi:hypothetical protein [Nonomuraea salmonea]|uniref:Uncharacterized protein n=1 Tax=Nonomuraea salmonea TaxID=46181 RepID=A0ABV5P2W3_9ACTN
MKEHYKEYYLACLTRSVLQVYALTQDEAVALGRAYQGIGFACQGDTLPMREPGQPEPPPHILDRVELAELSVVDVADVLGGYDPDGNPIDVHPLREGA